MYTDRGRRNINLRHGRIKTNSVAAWQKVELMMGKTSSFHKTSPPWLNKGVSTFGDIFNNTGLHLFQDIKEKYDLPGTFIFST